MWEIWYRLNDSYISHRVSNETYHNKETAKTYARSFRKHPAFKNSVIMVYSIEKDRFYNVD